VSSAPPANESGTQSGGGDNRARYSRQIEEAFESASKLAGSTLPPTEFYEQFLNRTLTAIDAPAGAVWLRTPQGFLQIACQVNLEKVGLENRRGGRQCHNEVLRHVFQAAPPRPVMLEPNGRMAPVPGVPEQQGGVPPANLTDYFALFAPIVTPEKQAMGILEVFQDSKHDPRIYPTFLNYAFQMAGYASQYHQYSNVRAASGMERTFTQVETFARLIHGTLNPTEVAYHIANEGRKLIECDRLCVGVRHARKKVTVESVSGADVVEKASTHVRRLRRLMEAVNQWGETLTFKGTKDAGLPPDVSHALDEYLNESQPKLLVVQPIRDEREKDKHKPARSILVLESFNPPEQTEPMIQRLEIVGKHAAPALYNAAQMKRVPLKFLWWPIAKVQEGVGGKARFITLLAVALLIILTCTMIFVPYQLRMEAKGQMQPVEIAKVYAPREGIVRELRNPGDTLQPLDWAVRLDSPQLQNDYVTALGKRNEAEINYKSAEAARAAYSGGNVMELFQVLLKRETAKYDIDKYNSQLSMMQREYRIFPRDPGEGYRGGFQAVTPEFDPKQKRPLGRSEWVVLNENRNETLRGRTVQPKEELLRVGNLKGTWQVELKIPQRNIGQVLRGFSDPEHYKIDKSDGRERRYLDVDVLLASMPDESFMGRLYQDELSYEAVPHKDEHNENEPVVTAYVKLNLDDFPADLKIPEAQFVTGLEVRTKIRCGKHALGYSLFHGVWEWFYEKVVFFF
jgi:hypothetical protein